MSMLTHRSPKKIIGTGKRLLEHDSHHYQRFHPYLKRAKVDSLTSKCNGLEISKRTKVFGSVAVPSRTLPPNDARSKAKPLVSCAKADALKKKMTQKNVKGVGQDDKSKYLGASGSSQSCDKRKTTSQHAPLAIGHPLSQLEKGFSVAKEFRRGCIGMDHPKCHDKLIKEDKCGYSLTGRKLEKNGYSENMVKDQSKRAQFIRDETCTVAQEKFALMNLSNAASALKIDVAGSRVSKLNSRADVSPFPQSNNSWIVAFTECPEVVSRSKVLKSIKLFEEQYTKLLQEQKRERSERGKANYRIDVKAAMILKKEGKWVNTVQEVGEVPGVEIGDQFQYRAELAVVGLHTRLSAGIDYIKVGEKLFATCIVDSGRYKNERRSPDLFIYTGEGGNPEISRKKAEDQKLKCGNLALKTSMDAKLPVRVVHCSQSLKAPNTLGVNNGSGLRYTYQGLYTVSSYCTERDESGKLVFKFTMRRMPDQPNLVPQLPSEASKSIMEEKQGIRAGICSVNATIKKKPPHCTYNSVLGGCSSRRENSHPKKSFGPIRSKGEGGSTTKAKSIAYQSGTSVKRTSFPLE